MADTFVRVRGDGKLLACLDRDLMAPGMALAARKLGGDRVKHVPVDLLDRSFLAGNDALVAVVSGSEAARHAGRLLGQRPARLAPGAYRIASIPNGGGSIVMITGGDRFGALAGLADVLDRCAREPGGLRYGGGDRTETPAFPVRFYWTWDHSTNWVLDDPGNQVNGCSNPYLKRPETFLEDYRRLIDHAVDTRFNAVIVCGFFRDSHGGEESAYEIARYGADRGVAVLPGIGTHSYSGIYYEGEHPANLDTFLAANPDCRMIGREGKPSGDLSPYAVKGREYVQKSLEWMMRGFPVGGVYLENGDYLVDYSRAAKAGRRRIPGKEEDFLKDQYAAYKCALDVLDAVCPKAWNIYATYCGFDMNDPDREDRFRFGNRGLGRDVPYFATHLPDSALCQWTLSGMLRTQPVPLRDWMDSPLPAALYDNPNWPRGLRPPTPRSAGFMHQGSQWSPVPRSALAVSTFAEGCARSHEAGLEGISIHGEASSRTMTWQLNYLAMRHWTYHPRSTLQDFARAELAPRVGGEAAALDFVEALCLLEEGRHPEAREIATRYIGSGYSWRGPVRSIKGLERERMWMEMKWWACQPDSAVRMLPRISDIV